VIPWRDELHIAVSRLYGLSGSFLITNTRYVPPLPAEADYLPVIPTGAGAEALSKELTAKLKEGAFQSRRKSMNTQAENERLIWAMMWCRMSTGSQSTVKEETDYENAFLHLDSVRLWGFIRRTHLTHVFGNGDQMQMVNVQEQEARYAELRQGEREFTSSFKVRFDNQLKANAGVGITKQTEPKLALEFIFKLDPRRYRDMLTSMRNDALRNTAGAYPQTLAAGTRMDE
jgi:hypothetical protein